MNQVTPGNVRVGVEIGAQTSGVERFDLCSVCDTPIVAGRVVLPRFMPGGGVEYDDPRDSETTIKVVWVGAAKGRRLKMKIPLRTAAFPQHLIATGEMAVAYFISHAPQGFWPVLNQGTLAVLFSFVWLYLSAAGPGPWSVDAVRAGGALGGTSDSACRSHRSTSA
jgi:hypothetical protein